MILRSMIRVRLVNCRCRDLVARVGGRVVYEAAALRLGCNRDAGTVHSVLLLCFPAYILLPIVMYFVGAMTAFMLIYWERTPSVHGLGRLSRHRDVPLYFHSDLLSGGSIAGRQDILAACPRWR
jgi:hypothetical protein